MKSKRIINLFCIFSILLAAIVSGVSAEDYVHEVKAKKMTFSWKIDGDTLAAKISAKTKGWVGIGFNPSEKMKGADFILGYVKKGKAKIIDEYGVDKSKHSSDKKLGGAVDTILVAGTEEDGITTLEFTIPLKSADKYDTVIDVIINMF